MTILNKVSNKTLMPGITPISDVPDAPTIGTATAVNFSSATVTYTAAATGGTGTTFTATSTPGSITGTGSSPITISGLSGSTSYTFKVRASNSTGTGAESSASNSITTPAAPEFVLLGRATASSSVSNLTVTELDQSYSHLELWIQCRTDRAAINDAVIATFNGVSSGISYSFANNEVNGNGTVYFARNTTTGAFTTFAGEIPGNSGSTSGAFGFTILQLFDYSSSTKNKSAFFMGGNNQNQTAGTGGAANNTWHQATWNTSQAVTSVAITPNTGPNFLAGSVLSVYGVK